MSIVDVVGEDEGHVVAGTNSSLSPPARSLGTPRKETAFASVLIAEPYPRRRLSPGQHSSERLLCGFKPHGTPDPTGPVNGYQAHNQQSSH